MTQIFEIQWSEGTISPDLVSSLLHEYFRKLNYPYGTIKVKEAAQQSVQPTASLELCPHGKSGPCSICMNVE